MSRRRVVRKVVVVSGVGLLLVVGLMQLVPYGWTKTNPPVTADAPWPDARSEAIARESCYACHSNETDWPAYSYVAPMSWLVRRDVESGHRSMPPSQYTLVHRGARLTDEEAATLVAALRRMDEARDDDGGGRGRGRGDDDDGGGGGGGGG
jgi:hypothetical protein